MAAAGTAATATDVNLIVNRKGNCTKQKPSKIANRARRVSVSKFKRDEEVFVTKKIKNKGMASYGKFKTRKANKGLG